MQWLLLAQNAGDDFGDGAGGIAPFGECVNAAADQDEANVFDQFVVDSLDGNVTLGGAQTADVFGDFGEMQRAAVTGKYEVSFVADALGVDLRPSHETPLAVEVSQALG